MMQRFFDGVLVDLTEEEAVQYEADQAAAAVTPVPSSVSRAQAKIALHRAGLLAQVEAIVGGEAAIWFADALTWERDNPHVVALGAALNLTTEQIDDLFIAAAQIQA